MISDAVWRVLGASVQGTGHQRREQSCQDAHAYRLLPNGLALLAVADGAGSAPRSDEGAACAVTVAVDRLATALSDGPPQDEAGWQASLADTFAQARQALLDLATAHDAHPRAFATTLTCAVAGTGKLAVGQIGDGVAVAQDKDGQLFAATIPQHGEYANETYFLTSGAGLERLQIDVFPTAARAVALLTDGLTRLALNVTTGAPHPPFFKPLLAFAARRGDPAHAEAQLAAFMASDRVCARTHDDKTLLLAVRPSQTPSAQPAAPTQGAAPPGA